MQFEKKTFHWIISKLLCYSTIAKSIDWQYVQYMVSNWVFNVFFLLFLKSKLVTTVTFMMLKELGLNINKEWRKLNVGKLYSWYFYEVMIMRWFRTIFSIPSIENIIIEFEIRFCSPRIFQLNNTQIFVKLKQK